MQHDLTALREKVESENACTLPGCTIKYDSFLSVMWRAVSRGYVMDHHAAFVADGLRNGFGLGLRREQLSGVGRREFKNYPAAYERRVEVTASIDSRVKKQKTLCLGAWADVKAELSALFGDYFIFPMGAVPKPHDPSVYRPTSDHTRTGLNALVLMGILMHSLNVYPEVAWLLKQNYFMYVSDVEDAFMIIPLAPWLWPFFLFRFFADADASGESLFVHLFGDFGTRGMPGTFKIFLVDVVVQMARSEMVLTLPMTVYVDDAALFGDGAGALDSEMPRFQVWSWDTCGVPWKAAKDRAASQLQHYIGFWWDSRTMTRSLDESKVLAYLDMLLWAASATWLTLRDRKRLAGRMERAVMTFPPGARCLLVNCYALMCGLVLSWQKRRTTKAERGDYRLVHDLLALNLGKGYYSYDLFRRVGGILSDASKSRTYTGGGWVVSDGEADYFKYGSSASRHMIDELEGDTVLRGLVHNGHKWKKCIVPAGIDNMAFEKSAEKGKSKAPRLNNILRGCFTIQIKEEFIIEPYWLSSEDNYLADDLSRGRPGAFFARLAGSGFLEVPVEQVRLHPEAGRVCTLSDDQHGSAMHELREVLKTYSSNYSADGPSRGVGIGGDAQLVSVTYQTCSIMDGLPLECVDQFDEVMDNRLAPSSRDKMMSGFNRWQTFALERGWSPFIESGDVRRGGRIAAWVLSMVHDTELTFASICTYVWGVRTWHVCQHQADPIHGVMHWREFIRGVATMTAVVGEPRKQVPLETVRAILSTLDPQVFEDAQLGLMMCVLLFTFSRTECPCPKTWTGRDSFDLKQHWTVKDFRLARGPSGKWVLWVRFKGIKQDPRIERGSAKHSVDWLPFDASDAADGRGRDWVPIGDVPDDPLFSVASWYQSFVRALARDRLPDDPMFWARDRTRAYTYRCLLADFKAALARVDGDVSLGPHGLRVLGYNLSKRGNGVELTVAHGGWMSEGHSRYERFSQIAVLGIPAGMLGFQSSFGAPDQPRAVSRSRASRGISGLAAAVAENPESDGYDAAADSGDEQGVTQELEVTGARHGAPPEYVQVRREYPSGHRTEWQAPDGTVLPSKPRAWAYYTSTMVAPDEHDGASADGSVCGSHSSRDSAFRRGSASGGRGARVTPDSNYRRSRTVHGGSPRSASEIVPEHERPATRRPPTVRARA